MDLGAGGGSDSVCGVRRHYSRLLAILVVAATILYALTVAWHGGTRAYLVRSGSGAGGGGSVTQAAHALAARDPHWFREFCAAANDTSTCPPCHPGMTTGITGAHKTLRCPPLDCSLCAGTGAASDASSSPSSSDTSNASSSSSQSAAPSSSGAAASCAACADCVAAAVAAATPPTPLPTLNVTVPSAVPAAWQRTSRDPLPPDGIHSGTIVFYCYFEAPGEPARDNLDFFIRVGVPQIMNRRDVHLIFILMSECSVELPKGPRIFVHKRRNFGMDVCAYAETLPLMEGNSSITGKDVNTYKYFVWMNASVRGPFMPWGSPQTWLEYFVGQLTPHDVLIGTSINCMSSSGPADAQLPGLKWSRLHLQSMFLVFAYEQLTRMRKFLPCSANWEVSVFHGELQFTLEALRKGYNVVSQLLLFRGVDWSDFTQANRACQRSRGGDHYFQANYNGINISPLEVIFFKDNRDGVDYGPLDRYTEWMLNYVNDHHPQWPEPIDDDDADLTHSLASASTSASTSARASANDTTTTTTTHV